MRSLKEISEITAEWSTSEIARETKLSFPTVKNIQKGLELNYTLKTIKAVDDYIDTKLAANN